MAYIQTVTAKIPPDSIGFCHSHEHLLLSKGVSYERNPMLLLDDPKKTCLELERFHAAGGDSIVEAQPVGCNRDALGLSWLADATGVNIIASTGFHKLIFYRPDHWICALNQENLYRIFLHELTEGMYVGCDDCLPERYIEAKAGQIKTALDREGLTQRYQLLFDAAGRAAMETGAPMMVHIENGADPMPLYRFLKEQFGKHTYIFCHMDRAVADLEIHKTLLGEGVYLEYDTIAREKYHSDKCEIEIIQSMLQAGYEDQLLVGLDSTRARLKSYTPNGPGLCYIKETFIPSLEESGVTRMQIDKMTRLNPGKAFAIREGNE